FEQVQFSGILRVGAPWRNSKKRMAADRPTLPVVADASACQRPCVLVSLSKSGWWRGQEYKRSKIGIGNNGTSTIPSLSMGPGVLFFSKKDEDTPNLGHSRRESKCGTKNVERRTPNGECRREAAEWRWARKNYFCPPSLWK